MTDRAVYLSTHDERMISSSRGTGSRLSAPPTPTSTATRTASGPPRGVTSLLETGGQGAAGQARHLENGPTTTRGAALSFEPGRSASAVSREHRLSRRAGRPVPVGHRHQRPASAAWPRTWRPGDARAGRKGSSRTAPPALDGTDEERQDRVARVEDVSEEMAATGCPCDAQTLVETYGRAFPRVLELGRKLPDGFERLCPSTPEIVPSSTRGAGGLAVSLQDVMLRRTGIGQSRCQASTARSPSRRGWPSWRAGRAPSRRRARGVLAALELSPAVPAP